MDWTNFEAMDKALGWNIVPILSQYPNVTLTIFCLIILTVLIFVIIKIYKYFYPKKEIDNASLSAESYKVLISEQLRIKDSLLKALIKNNSDNNPCYLDWIANLFTTKENFFDIYFDNILTIEEKTKAQKQFINQFDKFFNNFIINRLEEKQIEKYSKNKEINKKNADLIIKALNILSTPNYLNLITHQEEEKSLLEKYLKEAKDLLS